jgi:cytochrome P450
MKGASLPIKNDVPTTTVDFSDSEFLADPFPVLHELRELAPAVYNPTINQWVVCGFGPIRKVLAQSRAFPQNIELMRSLWGGDSMNAMDNPMHDIVRAVWKPHLLREPLERRQKFVEELTDGLLAQLTERLRAGETVDVVADLARPIPALAVGNLLGLPPEDSERWIAMAHGLGKILEARPGDDGPESQQFLKEGSESLSALIEYLDEQMQDRKRTGSTDDLIGLMVHANLDISHEDRRANIVQLVFAGHDTVEKTAAMIIAALVDHPETHAEMRNDRLTLRPALTEFIRWQSPVFTTPRQVQGEVEFEGITLNDGDLVGLAFGAGNRDPSRWDRPDDLDIHRDPLQNLAFGFGIHSCIGINLAHLELELLINKFLDAVPEYGLAIDRLDYGHNFTLRGPTSVPIRL